MKLRKTSCPTESESRLLNPHSGTICILIGSEHSLYTGKLRAYLIWRQLPFIELTASAELDKTVILPRTGVAFIPVLVLPDCSTVLQDTHAIIQHLEQQVQQQWGQQQQQQQQWQQKQQQSPPYDHLDISGSRAAYLPKQQTLSSPIPCSSGRVPASSGSSGPPPRLQVLPSSPRQAAASQLMELYGDEWLLLPAMHYRWSFPQQRDWIIYQFGSTSTPTLPYAQQMLLGSKVAKFFAGALPGLGITPVSIPMIEARFAWQLAILQEHFKHHAYLLGSSQPSTADFGFIGPLFAHLYSDPVPSCMMKCQAPLVADYVERLSGVGPQSRVADRVLQHGGLATLGHQGSVVTGLAPQDPRQPAQGKLIIRTTSNLQQQQQHGSNSSGLTIGDAADSKEEDVSSISSSEDSSSFLPGDAVPATVMRLLHHMFQEQVPVIISTLWLLKAWIQEQQTCTTQQKQQQQQASASNNAAAAAAGGTVVPKSIPEQAPTASGSSCTKASNPALTRYQLRTKYRATSADATHYSSSTSSDGGCGDSNSAGSRTGGQWLVVPRFLGMHDFCLFHPHTGAQLQPASEPLKRAASSYVAWRAAEVVAWYHQLSSVNKDAVRHLLADISTASSSCIGSLSGSSGSSECTPSVGGTPPSGPVEPAVLGVAAAAEQGPVPVDAVGAFETMVRLVAECGTISRRGNKVAVWLPNSRVIQGGFECNKQKGAGHSRL